MDGDLTTIRLNPYFDTRYSFELDFQFRWFVVNQHPLADVMPALLKSGQSASREKAVEEMKDCRSMKHPCHRSTVMPEYRLSIFYDRLMPISHTKSRHIPGSSSPRSRNHIEELEDLVSRSEQNEVSEYHMLCKIFPYSISGDAFSWFSDIERAFLYQFLDDAKATREKEKNDKWDMLLENWQIKREDQIPRQLLDNIMVEGNKQHRSEELSRAEEAETSYPTSALITTTNSTSIDTSSTTSIDGTTSTSNVTNLTSIDDSTLKSIDISSCDPTLDEVKEITMEDFLELEEFLELEDGEKLEDLDSSRKVTVGDFLELEEWLKDMDQNSKKKLDDDQHTSRGDLETSHKASIDRHQHNEIDRKPSYIIDQRPPYIIDRKSADSIDLHPHSIIDQHPPDCIDQHPWLDELPGYIVELEQVEERMYMSKASHPAVHEHQRPPICAEEAAGFHKRVKRIRDPVKLVLPCAVRGLRFRDEVDKGPAEAASINTDQIPSNDTTNAISNDINKTASIDATTSPLINTGHVSEQKKFNSAQQMVLTAICKASSTPYCCKKKRYEEDEFAEGSTMAAQHRSTEHHKYRSPLNCVDRYSHQWQEPKLTSNTKPDTTACLGAWYTWDRILQTSLEGTYIFVSGTSMKRGLWVLQRRSLLIHARSILLILKVEGNEMLRDEEGRTRNNAGQLINAQGAVIPDVIVVAEMNDFDLSREWYDWVGQDPFQGLPHQDPRNQIEELEDLVSRSEVSESHMLCRIFPYSISGDAFSLFSQLHPGSQPAGRTLKEPSFSNFLMMLKQLEKRRRIISGTCLLKVGRAEEAETSYPTSASITTTTSTSIDTSTATSIDGTTSTSTNVTTSTSINDSTLKSIDISSCDPTPDVGKEITMEDFFELEVFLELEDGEKLEDLDSSREVTVEDFLELEEWFENMDQNSKKKLDDDQHTSRGDLETSPKASIDRHQPDEIDQQLPYIIDQRHPVSSIDNQQIASIYTHTPSSIGTHPIASIDSHGWMNCQDT
ncbi:hypothetical protein F2Q69_00013039 [Brassica cretica]|uniref:Uncharacterized protein n=1 Tax=Brassica cretica TaxID=69181 RepID=A0A8S9R431_BRACR|nr:hypothetical protein F2Q69_00013039 [Brassica cretica]